MQIPHSTHRGTFGKILGALSPKETKLPLFSSRPQAGFPAPGDDDIEKILDINDLIVKNPASTFFVRVEGDSMEGTGIFSGDVLVVDRSIKPETRNVVLAAVFGELVVKRIRIESDRLVLLSENEKYPPIVVDGSDDCLVWGVVVGSVRTFI